MSSSDLLKHRDSHRLLKERLQALEEQHENEKKDLLRRLKHTQNKLSKSLEERDALIAQKNSNKYTINIKYINTVNIRYDSGAPHELWDDAVAAISKAQEMMLVHELATQLEAQLQTFKTTVNQENSHVVANVENTNEVSIERENGDEPSCGAEIEDIERRDVGVQIQPPKIVTTEASVQYDKTNLRDCASQSRILRRQDSGVQSQHENAVHSQLAHEVATQRQLEEYNEVGVQSRQVITCDTAVQHSETEATNDIELHKGRLSELEQELRTEKRLSRSLFRKLTEIEKKDENPVDYSKFEQIYTEVKIDVDTKNNIVQPNAPLEKTRSGIIKEFLFKLGFEGFRPRRNTF